MQEARLFLITGIPGVGKTTLVSKIVMELRKKGVSVGGIYSTERRKDKMRTGFIITDLLTGFQRELASITGEGPRIGKYKINLKNLAEFAAPAVENALNNSDIIVIDEVGPMELMSPEFRRAIKKVSESSKPAIIVVHLTMKDPLIDELKERNDAIYYEVTPQNRDKLPSTIVEELARKIVS